MGEGRNALYLAKLGWDVTGFDPADKVVVLAAQRAETMGLALRTVVAVDTECDFGREQWDLVLFSWTQPTPTAHKVIEALKPGGIVVLEGPEAMFPGKALLQLFDRLRVVHYQVELAPADFFNRREMEVVRFVAEKPARD